MTTPTSRAPPWWTWSPCATRCCDHGTREFGTFAESWRYLQQHWAGALIALGVVALAAGAANGVLWWGGRTVVGDGSDTPAALATVYALKNMIVIPVFMVALFRVFRWVPVSAAT